MRNQNGSALIITVLIVAVLTALVVEFVYEVYIDTAALSNWSNAQKASLIAKSGQAISSKYIPMIDNKNTLSEMVYPVENDLGSHTQLVITVEDENAKFNINNIIQDNGDPNNDAVAALKKLFEYLNIKPELVDVIVDWIDPDREPRLPYSEDNAKNAFFSTVDELKLIKGIDKALFEKISPYLTVHEEKKPKRFDTLININTAALPVLISLPGMNETLAQRVISYRESTPFEKTTDIQFAGIDSQMATDLSNKTIVQSTSFKITARATVNEITRIIESVVDRSSKIQFWREG